MHVNKVAGGWSRLPAWPKPIPLDLLTKKPLAKTRG